MWAEYIYLRLGQVAGSCENGNEHSDSIKGGTFLGMLVSY
jgi:hypothetical protein